MGRPEEEEPDLASEIQELLSINSEDDEEPAPAQLEPPEKTASPAEVRKYIVSLLQRRDVDLEQATTIAAKWRLGTGVEVREYTRDMYVGIFGAEDGWVIHKDVQADLAPEVARLAVEKTKADFASLYSLRWVFVTCLLLGLAVLGGGVAVVRRNTTSPGWELVGILISGAGGLSAVIGVGGLCIIPLAYFDTLR